VQRRYGLSKSNKFTSQINVIILSNIQKKISSSSNAQTPPYSIVAFQTGLLTKLWPAPFSSSDFWWMLFSTPFLLGGGLVLLGGGLVLLGGGLVLLCGDDPFLLLTFGGCFLISEQLA